MTTAGKIAVMQAYEDGKQIQFSNNNNEWKDWTIPLEPTWNWVDYDFRIKPEDKPVRMTNRQFAEWLGKGNGQFKRKDGEFTFFYSRYTENDDNNPVSEDILIRSWDSNEWITPTVEIYERDCKGE